MSLKHRKLLYILIGSLYFLFPRDVIPDWLGLLGRIDDLAVGLWLLWRYRRHLRAAHNTYQEAHRAYEKMSESRQETKQSGSAKAQSKRDVSFDPYEVLELERGASRQEIDSQYRKLAAQYHPDKVNHLGQELKELAHEKMVEIQRAYEMLIE